MDRKRNGNKKRLQKRYSVRSTEVPDTDNGKVTEKCNWE